MIVALVFTSTFYALNAPKIWHHTQTSPQKASDMQATEYISVSANKRIVFTCFLLSFVSLFTKQAFSQNVANNNNEQRAHNSAQMPLSSHQSLQRQVKNFLRQQLLSTSPNNNKDDLRILVREIDNRINIPFCDTPFDFSTNSSPHQQSNMSVKVTCNKTNWYLFMHATVSVIQEVVVTSDNLSPGALLSRRNLKVIEVDKNRLRGSTFASVDAVLGARIKRRVRAGNIINDRMLCFVCKGDRVIIAAISAGLSIEVYGVAEEDGVLGDTIQVRNISSDKLVFAKIASTSQVEINI